MTEEEVKETYLNEVVQSPTDSWPRPRFCSLDDQVFAALQWPEYATPVFLLENRWEAEYVRDKMHEVAPGRKYKMRWQFGGKLKRRERDSDPDRGGVSEEEQL